MPRQRTWKDRAMTGSEVITDLWDVTKAILARLAEWVLFACMVMNIIEILPGVILAPLVSNLVLSVQAVTLDVAGFGLASMADHARDSGDLAAARTGKRTGWFLIGLMIVTLLLVSIGLLWPVTQPFTAPAEKGLILARVIMTVIYSHVVHRLRRSTHTPQASPAAPALDYAEIARQVQAVFPPPAPQMDYQALAQQIAPLIPAPQVDYDALSQQLEARLRTTLVREVKATPEPSSGAGASFRSQSQSHLLALEPPVRATPRSQFAELEPLAGATPRSHLLAPEPLVRATRQGHLAEPEPLVRATRQSHLTELAPGAGATAERQPEPPVGASEARLQAAYQELAAEGGRVSGRALATRARCNRATATEWLQRHAAGAGGAPEPLAGATPEEPLAPEEATA
jgi:hypothetical protein